MWRGLNVDGFSLVLLGVTIGTGRKTEASLSRVIPGGSRIEEARDVGGGIDMEDRGGVPAADVETVAGAASRWAYRLSKRAREGDGSGTRMVRL
jgi:hypothetical protein